MAGFNRVATTAERIQEAMRITGKTQADLVRDTGLNKGTISRYISGAVEPRQEAFFCNRRRKSRFKIRQS